MTSEDVRKGEASFIDRIVIVLQGKQLSVALSVPLNAIESKCRLYLFFAASVAPSVI